MHPDHIGRYRLDRPVGNGAFGVVWLAYDDELEAPVAIKIMAENWAMRLDLRERFLSEARMLRRASSSRVVQVYDIGELPDSRPYFVMEYAGAGTLAEVIEGAGEGRVPVAEALRLAAEAALGVAALHENGILHRDVKPSNVLLQAAANGQRRVLVGDLGLAKSLAHASGLTLTAGSAGYMSPEQSHPTEEGIDERADVYGLGALTYHLLTGQVPGPPGKVVPLRRARAELPEEVQEAVLRAMAPERKRRWPSAQAYADELLRLAEEVDDSRGGSPRWVRPVLLASACVLGAAAGITGVVLAVGDRTAPPVRVQDATGEITLQVPRAWSGQLQASGWNPDVLGFPSTQSPGLVVADRLRSWEDLNSDVNGVFVGLAAQPGLSAKVAALQHPGCKDDGSHSYRGSRWHGTVHSWDDCLGGSRQVEEISLTPVAAQEPELYVQIRQHGGTDETDSVLNEIQVTS